MEFSINTQSLEDAEDLFILAKDRLLDVNEWRDSYAYTLTDSHKRKLHRNAHLGDFIKVNTPSEQWLTIDKIQYDDYPDIIGEGITFYMSSVNDPESMHTICINRVGRVVSVQGYNIVFAEDAAAFLKRIITTDVYAIAS